MTELRIARSGETYESDHASLAQPPLRLSSVDQVVRLMPGFVYVFNHTSFANDYANRSVATHLGYCAAEIRDLGPGLFQRIIHPDDLPALNAHMATIAALEDDAEAMLEYRVVTKTGAVRWLRSVDTVYDRAADGSVLRHIGCASDITTEMEAHLRLQDLNASLEEKVAERTRALAQLNAGLEARITARTAELEEAVEELEQLTHIATHDLKVPLNNLNRLGLMLSESGNGLSAEQAEQVEWIRQCAEQLNSKVQSLVLVTEIRMGARPSHDTLNLRAAVERAVRAAQPAMGRGALPVALHIDVALTVRFAAFEMDAILASLLDNAVKYAHPDRPLQVTIRAGRTGNGLWLEVADNGKGLDTKRDAATVFGLFKRGQKEPAGAGISLYCAQRMLQRCGATITAEGSRGVGATFRLVFPEPLPTPQEAPL